MTTSEPPNGPQSNAMSLLYVPAYPALAPFFPSSSHTCSLAATDTAAKHLDLEVQQQAPICMCSQLCMLVGNLVQITIWTIYLSLVQMRAIINKGKLLVICRRVSRLPPSLNRSRFHSLLMMKVHKIFYIKAACDLFLNDIRLYINPLIHFMCIIGVFPSPSIPVLNIHGCSRCLIE